MQKMIKNLVRRSISLFNNKQGTIISAAAVIMTTVFISRILGVVRERLLYAYFTPDEVGVYYAAFRLPNLLFELLVMGALSTAFIPVFANYLVKENKAAAFKLGAQIINLSVVTVAIFTVILFLFTKQISFLLVPGFNEQERSVMISFTRIMLIGQLVPLMIGNFITGMLQSFRLFLLPALAPIVYNLGIIFGIIFLTPVYGLYGAVWGVVIGAIIFLLIQLPLIITLGYKHYYRIDLKNRGTKEVVKLMLPRTFGLAISQIDTTVDLILASFLGTRNIAIFHSAQQLQQFPVGLFGATFAQAALPVFSTTAAKKDLVSFKKMILASMNQILFFVLPASVMLAVLRTPIVRLAYGAEKFDWAATVATGKTLSFFAISIFAQSLAQLFARAFYALYDTKTPVIIGVISVVINTVLSLIFVSFLHLSVWSLALSASVASIVNVILLLVMLSKKVAGFSIIDLWLPPIKMAFSSMTTGIFLYIPLKLLDKLVFDTTRVFDLILLTGVATISGLSVYIFLAWFLDIEEVATFFKLLQKVKRTPQVFFTQSTELVNGDQSSVS